MLVVLESTTYPGTTEQVVAPLLEERSGLTAGRDFALAYAPERIDPGNTTYGVRSTPKVVGGLTPACGEAAEALYGKLVDRVVRVRGTKLLLLGVTYKADVADARESPAVPLARRLLELGADVSLARSLRPRPAPRSSSEGRGFRLSGRRARRLEPVRA